MDYCSSFVTRHGAKAFPVTLDVSESQSMHTWREQHNRLQNPRGQLAQQAARSSTNMVARQSSIQLAILITSCSGHSIAQLHTAMLRGCHNG